MFEYPNLNSAAVMASRSFYRADSVNFSWNKRGMCNSNSSSVGTIIVCGSGSVGSAVLVSTTTEVDKTGASYYGEQGLHYLSARGEGNIVQLSESIASGYMHTRDHLKSVCYCVCR